MVSARANAICPDSTIRPFLGPLLAEAHLAHFLEVRALGGVLDKPQQWFVRVGDVLRLGLPAPVWALNGRGNVYYSVTPRVRPSGRGADCGPALAVWADFDSGAPHALPLAPSLVVESSPARFQAIWLLDAPCADVPLVEGINKTIALCYGADAAACDRPRVLRLPGFANLKYADRPKARLVVCKPELRYTMGQLEAVFPPQLQATPRITGVPYSADAPSWLALVFRALVDYLQAHDARPRPTSDGGILARCPLHQDHNPSLSLHPERGWKCFAGCGQGRLTLLAYKLGLQVPQGDSHE